MCKITLVTGRCIKLLSLDQKLTYGAIVLNPPADIYNNHIVKTASSHNEYEPKPYLISPLFINSRIINPMSDSTYNYLPEITCIAEFGDTHAPTNQARDEKDYWSWLKIVWFQQCFALPIDPDIVEKIQNIDWDHYATNTDFW